MMKTSWVEVFTGDDEIFGIVGNGVVTATEHLSGGTASTAVRITIVFEFLLDVLFFVLPMPWKVDRNVLIVRGIEE